MHRAVLQRLDHSNIFLPHRGHLHTVRVLSPRRCRPRWGCCWIVVELRGAVGMRSGPCWTECARAGSDTAFYSHWAGWPCSACREVHRDSRPGRWYRDRCCSRPAACSTRPAASCTAAAPGPVPAGFGFQVTSASSRWAGSHGRPPGRPRSKAAWVRGRRLRTPTDLADVLQRGGVHLVRGGRRLEVVQGADVAAHADHSATGANLEVPRVGQQTGRERSAGSRGWVVAVRAALDRSECPFRFASTSLIVSPLVACGRPHGIPCAVTGFGLLTTGFVSRGQDDFLQVMRVSRGEHREQRAGACDRRRPGDRPDLRGRGPQPGGPGTCSSRWTGSTWCALLTGARPRWRLSRSARSPLWPTPTRTWGCRPRRRGTRSVPRCGSRRSPQPTGPRWRSTCGTGSPAPWPCSTKPGSAGCRRRTSRAAPTTSIDETADLVEEAVLARMPRQTPAETRRAVADAVVKPRPGGRRRAGRAQEGRAADRPGPGPGRAHRLVPADERRRGGRRVGTSHRAGEEASAQRGRAAGPRESRPRRAAGRRHPSTSCWAATRAART